MWFSHISEHGTHAFIMYINFFPRKDYLCENLWFYRKYLISKRYLGNFDWGSYIKVKENNFTSDDSFSRLQNTSSKPCKTSFVPLL